MFNMIVWTWHKNVLLNKTSLGVKVTGVTKRCVELFTRFAHVNVFHFTLTGGSYTGETPFKMLPNWIIIFILFFVFVVYLSNMNVIMLVLFHRAASPVFYFVV